MAAIHGIKPPHYTGVDWIRNAATGVRGFTTRSECYGSLQKHSLKMSQQVAVLFSKINCSPISHFKNCSDFEGCRSKGVTFCTVLSTGFVDNNHDDDDGACPWTAHTVPYFSQSIDLCYILRRTMEETELPSCTAPALRGAARSRVFKPGAVAREQMIVHATRIFSTKGYAAATTREICEAAGVNLAAIHYYFGDKEGLYRTALLRPIKEMAESFGRFDDPELSFEQAIRMYLAPFLSPASGDPDDHDVQVVRMYLREMIEPSDVFHEITEQAIVPVHNALASVLAAHCGRTEPDADIHQLAFAMVAMAYDYSMSREYMNQLAPEVLGRPRAMEQVLDRLVGYCRALLDHEVARRLSPA